MTDSQRVSDKLREKNPLPHGTVMVGAGLAANGLTMFAFLFASQRVLSEESYSVLGVLWGLAFLVGPGFFLPLEQEVSRALASRRSRGVGARPVIRRAATLGLGVATALLILTALASGPLADEVFRGDRLFVLAFAISFLAYAVELLVRGVLSGTGQFSTYAIVLGMEGVSRFVLAVVLVIAGVTAAGWFGLALAVGPLIAAAFVALPGRRPEVADGPEVSTAELSTSLGWLLMGSVLTLGLMNIGPALIESLGGEDQALAGRFLNTLLVARIPLFLFQAVQAALLPAMADHAGAGRYVQFRQAMKQLMLAVTGVAAVGLAGSLAVGPLVAKILLGEADPLARVHFGALAVSMALYMGGLALAQALIALHHQRAVALTWAAAATAFVVTLVLIQADALVRVEMALLAGSVVACGGLAVLLRTDERWSEARAATGSAVPTQ